MTERFSEIISIQKIRDNNTQKIYDGLVDSEFLDLINEICEENCKLKGFEKDLDCLEKSIQGVLSNHYDNEQCNKLLMEIVEMKKSMKHGKELNYGEKY